MDNKFKVETSVASRSLFENGCLFTAAAFEYLKSWSFNILFFFLIWIRGKHDPCLYVQCGDLSTQSLKLCLVSVT
ncbi:unnamed protein product [Brassica rapa]|uniref:Uncharacterized protein n=1 Tax=Brassica campestris TaxID=3711 RepID=A0A8D9GW83_BRACM|nr:unnamed protein product [Brassica rapa]